MSFPLIASAFDAAPAGLTAKEHVLLLALLNRAHPDGSGIWADEGSLDSLAYAAQISHPDSFRKTLKKLKDRGVVIEYWTANGKPCLKVNKEFSTEDKDTWLAAYNAQKRRKGKSKKLSERRSSFVQPETQVAAKSSAKSDEKSGGKIVRETESCRQIIRTLQQNRPHIAAKSSAKKSNEDRPSADFSSQYSPLYLKNTKNYCFTYIPVEEPETGDKNNFFEEREKSKTELDCTLESLAAVSVEVIEHRETVMAGLSEMPLSVSDLSRGADEMSEAEKDRKRMELTLKHEFGEMYDRLIAQNGKLGGQRKDWLNLSFEDYLDAKSIAERQLADKKAQSYQGGLIYALDGMLAKALKATESYDKALAKRDEGNSTPRKLREAFKAEERVKVCGRLGVVSDSKPERVDAGIHYLADATIDFDDGTRETYVGDQLDAIERVHNAPAAPDFRMPTSRIGSLWQCKATGMIYKVVRVEYGAPVTVDAFEEEKKWSVFGATSLGKACEAYTEVEAVSA